MYQNLDKYQTQIDNLKAELAEQREQRAKSERVFIETCAYLKSEAESLKSTIERLQNKLEPSPGLQILQIPADHVEPFCSVHTSMQPPAQISMELQPRTASSSAPVMGGSGRSYLPISIEGISFTRVEGAAPADPIKDAMAAARFRRMLGGRLQRSAAVVWQ